MFITTGFKRRFKLLLAPFVQRLQLILTSGLAPRRLAATCCVGILIGVMPLLIGSTLLCIVIASRYRLNQLVLQAVSYLAYPLQLALFIPFFKLGDRLLGWGPAIPHHLLESLWQDGLTTAAGLLGWITLKAMVAWLLTAAPLAVLLYLLLLKLLPRHHCQAFPCLQDVAEPLLTCNHGDTSGA